MAAGNGRYPGVYTRDGGKTFCFRAQFGDSHGRWGVSASNFRTKKDAAEARAQAIQEAEAQRGRASRLSANVTVSEYLEHWLRVHGGVLRPASIVAYRSNVRALQRHAIAAQKVRAVQDADIRRLIGELRAQTMRYDTMMGRLRTLRVALNAAVRDGLIRTNPAAGVRVARTTERFKAQTWSPEEAQAFLRNRRELGDPMLHAWRLALVTGLRRGELLGLRWADVDLEHCSLEVRRQRVYVNGEMLEGPPKTASSEAVVHLDAETCELLRSVRQAASSEYVVPDPGTGRPWGHLKSFQRRWHGACAEAGVPGIRFHDLRHTAATLLAGSGTPMRVVQERLRHWSPQMTERYVHASAGAGQLAAESMGALLAG